MSRLTMMAALIQSIGSGSTNPGTPGVLPIADEVFNAQTYFGDGNNHRNIRSNVQLASRYFSVTTCLPTNFTTPIAHPKPGHIGTMTFVLQGTSSGIGTYWSPDSKGGTQGSGQTAQYTYTALGDEQSFTLIQTGFGSTAGTLMLLVVGGVNDGKSLRVGSAMPGANYGAASAAVDQTGASNLPSTKVFSGSCRPYNSTISYTDDTNYPPVSPASYGNTQTQLVASTDFSMTLYGATSPGGMTVNGINYGRANAATPGQSPGSISLGCLVIYFDPQTAITSPGGMVMLKNLTGANASVVLSTLRSAKTSFSTVGATIPAVTSNAQEFSADGVLTSAAALSNTLGSRYAAWSFRKSYKFFDQVTWTGDGTNFRALAHGLGIAPGMIWIKDITVNNDIFVYHKDVGPNQSLFLDLTVTPGNSNNFGNTVPTESNFYVGQTANTSGHVYEAYLFAHDVSNDGVIQCGSFTVAGGVNNIIDLGGEAQWVLAKRTNVADSWRCYDASRAFGLSGQSVVVLETASVEAIVTGGVAGDPSGFKLTGGIYSAGDTVVYMAIKRSKTKPVTGRQVYNAITRTGTSVTTAITGAGFSPDLVINRGRSGSAYQATWYDRPRGSAQSLSSNLPNVESATGVNGVATFDLDGVTLGNASNVNSTATTWIHWFLKRYPGVFDITTWTGNNATVRSLRHNLGVLPELVIVKARNNVADWKTWSYGYHMRLNFNAAYVGPLPGGVVIDESGSTIRVFAYNDTDVTDVNASGINYVAYLFATLAGVSKVGTYVGNGGSVDVNCGFTTGARFVMIKRTDVVGDWIVMDTIRGIIVGNDPSVIMNSSAAEATTVDSIVPLASGFTAKQNATTQLNANGGNYTFVAIA